MKKLLWVSLLLVLVYPIIAFTAEVIGFLGRF